jgi:hypothetical protein
VKTPGRPGRLLRRVPDSACGCILTFGIHRSRSGLDLNAAQGICASASRLLHFSKTQSQIGCSLTNGRLCNFV